MYEKSISQLLDIQCIYYCIKSILTIFEVIGHQIKDEFYIIKLALRYRTIQTSLNGRLFLIIKTYSSIVSFDYIANSIILATLCIL